MPSSWGISAWDPLPLGSLAGGMGVASATVPTSLGLRAGAAKGTERARDAARRGSQGVSGDRS
jgi:hypothetical protein